MKVVINSKEYTQLRNISLSLATDLTGNTLPTDEMSLDIITEDDIQAGKKIELYSDVSPANKPWLTFRIMQAERIESANIVSVHAVSLLYNAENTVIAAGNTDNSPVTLLLYSVFLQSKITGADYSDLDGINVTGPLPEQTAKEQIQWFAFVSNAFVRSGGENSIEIKLLDDEADTIIPLNQTFWRPSISYDDWVESVSIVSYAFSTGTPSQGDETITIGNTTYIVTSQTHKMTNPNLPQGIKGQEIVYDGIYLVNENNWSDILSYLATLYFNRATVDADVINNELVYRPGDHVSVYLDEERMVSGFIESVDMSFGVQARATLHLNGVDEVETANLVIKYKHEDSNIGKKTYRFPVGYEYSIENPYIDNAGSKHRYIYRPLNEFATGTMVSGTNENVQQCEIALHFTYEDETLLILSVSGVEEEGTSGVIAIE